MKLMGMFLSLYMIFNVAFAGTMDACYTSLTSCPAELEKCHDESNSTATEKSSSHDGDHAHCQVHCAHHAIYLNESVSLSFSFAEAQPLATSRFLLTQTILDGPFRPPLAPI